MATNDPNANAEIQDYLRLEFSPEPEEGVVEMLNFGWHRVNVRPKKYKSYPFASYQYNTSAPSAPAGTSSPPVAAATRFGGPRSAVKVEDTHDHSVYALAADYRAQIGATFDGGGSAIQANQECTIRVENGIELDSYFLMADQTGSIQIDVWSDVWANYPPTAADSMCTGVYPYITSDDHNSGLDLALWGDTTLADGDVVTFHVNSCSTIERCTIILVGNKT